MSALFSSAPLAIAAFVLTALLLALGGCALLTDYALRVRLLTARPTLVESLLFVLFVAIVCGYLVWSEL